jgi:hypothetical protein
MRLLIVALAAGALLLLVFVGWDRSPSDDVRYEPAPEVPAASTGPEATGAPGDAGQSTEAQPPSSETATAADPPPHILEELGAGSEPETAGHEILAEMRRAWECYEAPGCVLGEERDPRAEYFEAGERVAQGMRALTEQHRAHRISDVELADAAHEVLGYESGRARAAAIEALGELPPSAVHLDALIDTLDRHHDERLFELALAELERYVDRGHRAEIDEFLQSNLRFGAHFPARTIARELGPFLSPENVVEYRRLAEELPAQDRRAELLKETLEAYERAR